MIEEQGPDACLCPRNIAAIRDARLKQLIRKHRVDRPAPACLPDDLREDWNDKEALKAGPRGCVLCKAGPRECPLLSAPVGHVDTPSGLHQAEPAAGHQAVPAARAAGAGCQPAAGAGCQPVDPAPQAPPSLLKTEKPITNAVAPSGAADAAGSVEFLKLDDGRAGAGTDAGRPGHDAPIWVDINPNTAYPGTLNGADVRLAGPPPAPGDLAAAPSGAADAAGSVEFLNLDDGRAGAGTDAGRPGHDAPIWVDINPNTAYPGTLNGADVRLAGLPPAPGDLAAAPSGAADAAGSVDLLDLDDGLAGAGTDAGRPGHDAILDGMQALRFETATKDDMAALTTAMETGFDEIWMRLDAMEKRMSKRLDAMEERAQSFSDGWKMVPDEDDASGATNEWDVSWSWNPRWPARWGWQGCRRRRTPEDGARGSR